MTHFARIPRWILSCLLLLAGSGSVVDAQIVNTLSGFEDEPGWSGGAEARFAQAGGNTDVLTLGAAAKVQWQSAAGDSGALGSRHRVRVLGGATRSEADGRKVADSSMSHLRYNYRITPWLATVTFVQHQRDPFQRLQSRFLLGAGLRFDIVRQAAWELSLGGAHMSERESIREEPAADYDQRLSTFLLWVGNLTSSVEVNVTGFYQPRWSDWGDARATASGELRVDLASALAVGWSASLQHDSRPPEGVKSTDWSYLTKLIVSL
ncbi:MAG: DUF481 domain-containing protein [Candidatus Eisenbacteria bacterium]|uniref:DUF481 domain-containing protein n=1 Tax=Eiseniibacteriota bacterium TaxID=2212470 RepID=A0A956LXX8_UNCEI|nr:DUF481 domain-containing protein [Candidatus Eisenbacteria bacterium]